MEAEKIEFVRSALERILQVYSLVSEEGSLQFASSLKRLNFPPSVGSLIRYSLGSMKLKFFV